MSRARGSVQLVDAILGTLVLVALIALSPFFARFTGMAASASDPFSALLFRLVIPLLFIGLIVSIGVSARRGA
jgi:hypothetical protein